VAAGSRADRTADAGVAEVEVRSGDAVNSGARVAGSTTRCPARDRRLGAWSCRRAVSPKGKGDLGGASAAGWTARWHRRIRVAAAFAGARVRGLHPDDPGEITARIPSLGVASAARPRRAVETLPRLAGLDMRPMTAGNEKFEGLPIAGRGKARGDGGGFIDGLRAAVKPGTWSSSRGHARASRPARGVCSPAGALLILALDGVAIVPDLTLLRGRRAATLT
jgi:hypothetical protein